MNIRSKIKISKTLRIAIRNSYFSLLRYWHSTAAFSLGRAIKNNPTSFSLPPEGDCYYRWPDDLLKPDKVILMHVSEEERLKRLSRRTRATDEENQLKADAEFRRTCVLLTVLNNRVC